MNVEEYFKKMYFNIWQGHDLDQMDCYYARDFKEIITMSDDNKQPICNTVYYDDIVRQAIWQRDHYRDTTLDIKKIVAGDDQSIFVHFYSSSIEVKTGQIRHRYVCGIWQLNQMQQINQLWATVTPYYPA